MGPSLEKFALEMIRSLYSSALFWHDSVMSWDQNQVPGLKIEFLKLLIDCINFSDHLSQNDSQDSGDLTTASTSDETIMSDSRVSTMAEAGDL